MIITFIIIMNNSKAGGREMKYDRLYVMDSRWSLHFGVKSFTFLDSIPFPFFGFLIYRWPVSASFFLV